MNNKLSRAEAIDLMNSRIALGLLLASLAYGLEASVYLFTSADNHVIKWLGFAISMLAALWIFLAVAPELWNKIKRQSIAQHEAESFVTDSFHKAIIKSWAFTIATLVFITVIEQFIARIHLPLEFYINGLIFIMLFSASITFLISTNGNEDDDSSEDMVQ